MKKRFISLFLAAVTVLCCVQSAVFAADNPKETDPSEFDYSEADGEVTINKYNGSTAEVVIPSQINGSPVTKIGDMAFSGCTDVTSLTFSGNIKALGENTTLNSGIRSIAVYDENPYFSSSDGVLFNKDKTEIVIYPPAKESSSYKMPQTVVTVGENAFINCLNLTRIEIPQSVTEIKRSAFSGCGSLSDINIPKSVTVIGDSAFSYCSVLKSVVIPQGVTEISNGLFSGCYSLESVTIPDSVTSIGNGSFSDNYCLAKLDIPESVTSISDYAFMSCISLSDITIPHSVETIAQTAFDSCYGLTSVFIENSVNPYDIFVQATIYLTKLGDNAYWAVNGDTLVIYGSGELQTIADEASLPWADFMAGFENIDISDDVTNISPIIYTSILGDRFTNATESVILGTCILAKYVGDDNAKIDGNIKTVCEGAFGSEVKSVSFSDSVTSIASGAFKNSSEVTVKGYKGSAAESYAQENSMTFEELKVVKGCVDGGEGDDLKPTMADAMKIFNSVVEEKTTGFFCNAAADVDDDANVTLLDTLALLLIMQK